ncbi:acyltransferase family protein [Rhizorhabdus argentea]|uniref:acyltransferase family protein n=1 Tax=Rhizorhabdus argentea TaxID=1387174 RepID=UPI0030EB5887
MDQGDRSRLALRDVGELAGIQYLRGVAAIMVLIYHVPVQLGRMGYAGPWPAGLSGGVDIFYVISGFIMWVTTIGRPQDTPLTFWRRRILRIVPLYWAVTGFVIAVMLVSPGLLQSSRFDPAHVAASFLFIGYGHPLTHMVEPVVIPGWTLNHEMFFYLLFGLFLLAPTSWRFAGMISTLALLVLLGSISGQAPDSVGGFYTSGMLLEFGLGIAIGVIATRGEGLARLSSATGWTMLTIGAAGVMLLPQTVAIPRLLASGVPSALLLAGLLVVEMHHGLFRSALLHGLGDASYSIYLSHMITLSATSQLWRALGLATDLWALALYTLLSIAVSVLAGCLLYLFVEKPLSRRLHRRPGSRAKLATA